MAIDAYVGLPGAGKSHGVVESVILPALRAGRRVCHNMPLVDAELLKLSDYRGELVSLPDAQSADRFVEWFRTEHAGALLVLDESWRYWSAGMKAMTIPEAQREFFAMHRHMVGQTSDGRTTDIVLVAQNLGQIAQFVRDLVEQTFHYSKMTVIGAKNRYRCDVYSGAVTGSKPPVARRTNSYHARYKREVFACYQSHTLSRTGHAGLEDKPDKRGNILRSWRFRGLVACVLCAPLLVVGARREFFAVGYSGQQTGHAAERSDAAVTGFASSLRTAAVPIVSSTWRIVGVIQTMHSRRVLLSSVQGSRVLMGDACLSDVGGNLSCLLDGELITEWSGHVDRSPVQAFVAAASTPALAH